jgi:hypothetical protein
MIIAAKESKNNSAKPLKMVKVLSFQWNKFATKQRKMAR